MFLKKKTGIEKKYYDPASKKPVIRCSICTGEQIAGFQDKESRAFEEIMLIRSNGDLEFFKEQYGIHGDIDKIY